MPWTQGWVHDKNIRDEWNSGCDRLKVWQARVKLFSLDCNAAKELSNWTDMKSWAYNVLMEHSTSSAGWKVPDWTGGPVWVTPRKCAGAKGALTVPNIVAKCMDYAYRRFPCGSQSEKTEPTRTHKARPKCCCAYCGAYSEHETDTCIVTMQHGDEDVMCMVYEAECPQGNCKWVLEALPSHRRVYGGFRSGTV